MNERLKEIRLSLKLSPKEFVAQIGNDITYHSYTSYESGERKIPIKLLEILNIKFNVNLNWLVTGNGDMFLPKSFEDSKDEFTQRVKDILKEEGLI